MVSQRTFLHMKFLNYASVCALSGAMIYSAFAQDTTQSGDSSSGTTEPLQNWHPASDVPTPDTAPAPALSQPTIQYMTLFRKLSNAGILAANGAEIILPGVSSPANRSANSQEGHLNIIDTAADGSSVTTSWDISQLTNRYKPSSSPKGYTTHTAIKNDDDGSDSVAPDRLPGEVAFAVVPIDQADASAGISLGTVFVDGANRIFYTPPKANIVVPLPAEVSEINAVSHLANNGSIVAEWDKVGESKYHVLVINTSGYSVNLDFTPDTALEGHDALTWIDGVRLLGHSCTRTGDEYGIVNLISQAVTSKVRVTGRQVLKAQNGEVNSFSPPSE